jgi:hypothetical protein
MLVDVEPYAEGARAAALGPRVWYAKCAWKGADARPHWAGMPTPAASFSNGGRAVMVASRADVVAFVQTAAGGNDSSERRCVPPEGLPLVCWP